MVRLCWALVSVFAFLPHVTTPYQVGTGCNAAELQVLVDDAMNLVNRATWVLNDYLGGMQPNQPPNPLRDGAVRNILNALIGTVATSNVQNIRTIRDRFMEMVTGVGGGPGIGTANLKIHCQDPVFVQVYTPPQPPPPSQPLPAISFPAFPVELTRIGGQTFLHTPLQYFSLIGGSQMYLNQVVPFGNILGYTFQVSPGTPAMQYQQHYTGSSAVWSDVVLIVALQIDPQKVNLLSEVNDWRPEQLLAQQIGGVPMSLWQIGGAQIITLIHELMHSTVLAQPITLHAVVGNEHANGAQLVMDLADTNGANVVDNPDTYAFLALALSMPWLKWWNNNDQDRNGPPVADGYKYFAQYNLQFDPQGIERVYMPTFGRGLPPNLPVPWIQQELAKGPRAFS